MRLKGDTTVNAVLDNALERESQFTRKKSTIVRAQEVHNLPCTRTVWAERCQSSLMTQGTNKRPN